MVALRPTHGARGYYDRKKLPSAIKKVSLRKNDKIMSFDGFIN